MFTNFYKNIIYILHHLNIHHWWSDQSSWSWLYMSIIDDQFSWWFHEDLELKPCFCSLTAPAAQHLDGLSGGMEAVSKRVELRLCQKIATAHLWSRYTRKSVVFGSTEWENSPTSTRKRPRPKSQGKHEGYPKNIQKPLAIHMGSEKLTPNIVPNSILECPFLLVAKFVVLKLLSRFSDQATWILRMEDHLRIASHETLPNFKFSCSWGWDPMYCTPGNLRSIYLHPAAQPFE